MKRDCTCPRARHEHGTKLAYQVDGCRCFPCRIAHSRAKAAYRDGLPAGEHQWAPSVGITRRLQALHAIGWTWKELAPGLGITPAAARQLAHKPRTRSYDHTRATVCALYDELWHRPRTGTHATRARRAAARKDWYPPLAWDDDSIDNPDAQPDMGADPHRYGAGRPTETVPDVIDEIAVAEAIHGRPVRLTAAETAEAVARLSDRGLAISAIAVRLRVSERCVSRHRARQEAA